MVGGSNCRKTGGDGTKMGAFGIRDAGGGTASGPCRAICVAVVAIALALPSGARAACDLPAAFGIAAEEHGLLDRGTNGVVATASAPAAGLVAGDVIRQANGMRVSGCADLERAAADALAQGLVLLLAIERGDQRIALAATTRESIAGGGAVASSATAPQPEPVAPQAPPAERGAPAAEHA